MSFVLIGDLRLLLLISGDNSRAGNSQANLGDSRLWIVSPSLQIIESEILQIIAEVCHFL